MIQQIKITKRDKEIPLLKVFNFYIFVRPDTTDSKVIDEVLKRNVYQKPSLNFHLQKGELWFDLGGNIGTFSLLALSKGCNVIVYEPEPENAGLLEENLKINFKTGWTIKKAAITHTNNESDILYLSKGLNKYRHTLYPKRGRESINVASLPFKSEMALHKPIGVKMDIEGIEIDILESVSLDDWRLWNTQKLVFEYSFDIDNSIPRFMNIIRNLRKYFSVVHYNKVKETERVYNYFPAATLVYCLK
jgi:FkbM family methyltransferase